MKTIKPFLVLSILSLIFLEIHASENDTINYLSSQYADTISSLKQEIQNLKTYNKTLDNKFEQTQELSKIQIETLDSRNNFTISFLSIVFSIIMFGGGFLIYFTSIQPAREILKNFNKKVDKQFELRASKELHDKITLIAEKLKENFGEVNSKNEFLLQSIPYPLDEQFREQLIQNILFPFSHSTKFSKIFDLVKKYFFTIKDSSNDRLAEFLIRSDLSRSFVIHTYVTEFYNEDEIIDLLYPDILSWENTFWYYLTIFCHSKYDKLFRHMEKKKMLYVTFVRYNKLTYNMKYVDDKGRTVIKNKFFFNNQMDMKGNGVRSEGQKTYAFIKYREYYEKYTDTIFDEIVEKEK